jgi:hypothetical protein
MLGSCVTGMVPFVIFSSATIPSSDPSTTSTLSTTSMIGSYVAVIRLATFGSEVVAKWFPSLVLFFISSISPISPKVGSYVTYKGLMIGGFSLTRLGPIDLVLLLGNNATNYAPHIFLFFYVFDIAVCSSSTTHGCQSSSRELLSMIYTSISIDGCMGWS